MPGGDRGGALSVGALLFMTPPQQPHCPYDAPAAKGPAAHPLRDASPVCAEGTCRGGAADLTIFSSSVILSWALLSSGNAEPARALVSANWSSTLLNRSSVDPASR